MTLRPTGGLALALSGVVVIAEFDTSVRDGTGAVLGGILEGNRLPSMPKLAFTVSFTYNFSLAGRESYLRSQRGRGRVFHAIPTPQSIRHHRAVESPHAASR